MRTKTTRWPPHGRLVRAEEPLPRIASGTSSVVEVHRMRSILLSAAVLTAQFALAQCPSSWSTPGGGVDDVAWSLARLPDGSIVAGGDFHAAGGAPAGYLAAWNAGWSSLAGGMDDRVRALAVTPNGDVFAGGMFLHAGGVPANRIARWNGTTWSRLGAGIGPGIVSAILVEPSGSLLVAGGFSTAGGNPASCIARWNGASWSALGTGIVGGGVVRTLAQTPNGDVHAGGLLSVAGSLGICRYDGATWSGVGTGMAGGGFTAVLALLALPNGDLIAGGNFTSAGGVPATNIARWDGSAWSPLGSGTDAFVNALLLLPDGDLVAGGAFATAGGVSSPYLARWNGTAWTAMNAGLDAAVEALALLPNGDLLVAGRFTTAAGVPAAHVVVRATACPASAASYGSGCTGTAGPVTLSTVAPPWLGGTCRARATGLPLDALAVGVFGFGQLAMPMPTVHPAGTPGCTLLVTDEILLHFPLAAASVDTALPIPDDVALIGATFFHQVVVVERDGFGGLASLTATNGLALTIGAL
jgi:trimeric autotransporter adhesin